MTESLEELLLSLYLLLLLLAFLLHFFLFKHKQFSLRNLYP